MGKHYRIGSESYKGWGRQVTHQRGLRSYESYASGSFWSHPQLKRLFTRPLAPAFHVTLPHISDSSSGISVLRSKVGMKGVSCSFRHFSFLCHLGVCRRVVRDLGSHLKVHVKNQKACLKIVFMDSAGEARLK